MRLDGELVDDGDPAACHSRAECFSSPKIGGRHGLIVDFSIRENVSLPALRGYAELGTRVRGSRTRGRQRRVPAAAASRPPSIEVRTATLSGGNQQKVVLAKWLALGPKVLIVDEPTRGIDVGAKAEIYGLLRAAGGPQGVSIVMISSDMEEVLHVSDRVAVMHEGAITGVLERAECTEERIMALAVGQPAPAVEVAGIAGP